MQTWTNVPTIYSGMWVLWMITIDSMKCRTWYKEQPLCCDICEHNHKAASYPLRGKCKRCCQEGHLVRDCPQPAWYLVSSAMPLVIHPLGPPLRRPQPRWFSLQIIVRICMLIVFLGGMDCDDPPPPTVEMCLM